MNGHLSSASPVPSTSSSTTLPPAQPQPTGGSASYMEDLSNHLLQGWSQAEFSDAQLHVQYADSTQGIYHLHALIVSQSPLLKKLLQAAFAHHHPTPTSPRPIIILPLSDPSITSSSLGLSLASLYSPSVLTHLDPSIAPSVLATASFLGLERLAAAAFGLCESAAKEAKTAEEVEGWIAYVEREKGPLPFSASSAPTLDGSGSPNLNGKAPSISTSSSAAFESSYETRLRSVLLSRLISLPTVLSAFDPARAAETQPQLIDVLKRLPFEVFKVVVENEEFKAPSDMDRFNFAKKCIAARKQLFLSQSSPSSSTPGNNTPTAPDFEETVVLQFGQSGPGASAVNVLRKQRRPALWKVGGSLA